MASHISAGIILGSMIAAGAFVAYTAPLTTGQTYAPTAGPTPSPTAAPSTSPTPSPTVATAGLFNGGVYTPDENETTLIAQCEAARAAMTTNALTCSQGVVALRSNSTLDMADFPAVYHFDPAGAVTGYQDSGDTALGANWAGIAAGTLSATLATATGATVGNLWWSGSLNTGAVSTTTCEDWTNATAAATGTSGSTTATDGTWLQSDIAEDCSGELGLVCVCLGDSQA